MFHLVFIGEYETQAIACDISIDYSIKGIPDTVVIDNKLYLKCKKYVGESMFFWEPEDLDKVEKLPDLNNPKTIIVDSVKVLSEVINKIKYQKVISVDLETTGLNPWLDGIVGIAIAWGVQPNQSCYIPVGHWVGVNLPLDTVREYLGTILNDPDIYKVFHNAKFDIKFLLLNGFNIDGLYFDTMVVHWLLYCHEDSRHGLKEVISKYVNKLIEVPNFKDLMKEVPKGTKHKNIGDLPPDRVGYYAGLDVVNTFHCYLNLFNELKQNNQLYSLWFDLELIVLNILIRMELTGLVLNPTWYEQKVIELNNGLAELQAKGREYSNELNIFSTQQLNKFFFEVVKLPTEGLAKNKLGYCLDKAALNYIKDIHPLASIVIEARHLKKMLSTYVVSPINKLNKVTNRLHTEYKQIGTVTGRLSSLNPNSQNYPTEYREGIIASPGHVLFAADYSGCEYRILSSLSNCNYLIQGYLNNIDAHTSVAKMIFPDKNPKDINPSWGKDYRFIGKQINFAIVYGKQPQSLASWMNIDMSEVDKYYSIYWQNLSEVKELMEYTHKKVVSCGYSETVLGRRRLYRLTDEFYIKQFGLPIEYIVLKKDNNPIDAQIFRQSFNAIIQGSNADITKLAMRETTKYIKENDYCSKLLLQIHDELIFEVPYEEIDYLPQKLVDIMESVYTFKAPLKVDYRIGHNWKQVKG